MISLNFLCSIFLVWRFTTIRRASSRFLAGYSAKRSFGRLNLNWDNFISNVKVSKKERECTLSGRRCQGFGKNYFLGVKVGRAHPHIVILSPDKNRDEAREESVFQCARVGLSVAIFLKQKGFPLLSLAQTAGCMVGVHLR